MKKRIIDEVIEGARDLSKYDVGETIEGLASKLGKKPSEILKLNSNENLFMPLDLLRDVLRQVVDEVDPRIYPRDEYGHLREAISGFMNVPEECIAIGAGSDQLIETISEMFLRDGYEALSMEPTFPIYERCVRIQGASYRAVPLKDDFTLDVDSMMSAINPNTRIIFLCSPNNPTANQLGRENILSLCEEFEGLVVVDETYADFAGVTLADAAVSLDNLIVFRTFSKTFGLAGLRVGYAVGNRRLVKVFEEKFQMPYSVSTIALKAAVKVLERWGEVAGVIEAIREQREILVSELNKMSGVRAFPSETNFVLFQVNKDSSTVYRSLLEKGVIVRNLGRVLRFDNCLRVTVAPSPMTERFLRHLSEVLL